MGTVAPAHALEPALAAAGAAPAPAPLDGVLPFRIDAADARTRVRRWVRRSWLAAPGFRRATIGEATAIHLPCYTFSADTESRYSGTATSTHRVKDHQGKYTGRTRTSTAKKSGVLVETFENLAVCSVPALEAPNLRRLEPWPVEDATPAVPVEGTPRSQLPLPAAAARSRERLADEVAREIRDQMGGTRQHISSVDTTRSDETYRHVLLPVLVVPVTHRLATQYVLVNGATGKVGGRRPHSRQRRLLAILAAVWLFFLVVGAVMWPEDCNPRCSEDPTGAPASQPFSPAFRSDGGLQ